MKFRTLIIPSLVGYTMVTAYFAGIYVGTYDTKTQYLKFIEQSHVVENGERLWMMQRAASLLREKRSDDALLVLDRFSDTYVASVAQCLDAPECAHRLGSAQQQKELQDIVQYFSKVKKIT